MVEVEVEYDYSAQQPDELTLKKGDIIKNVVQQAGGWWEGTLSGKTGYFPDNFVKVLSTDGVTLRHPKEATRIRQCRAVFSYRQDQEDELTLKTGDIITVVGEEEEGWWRGLLNGKQGVFPCNFVEEIQSPIVPKPTSRKEPAKEVVPALPAKPVKQQCRARFSYDAQNTDELNLLENDLITVLSTDGGDPGWWKGELNGKVGWFPDNFVELVQPSSNSIDKARTHQKGDTSPSNKVESKPSADTSAIKQRGAGVSQLKSLKNAPAKPPETKSTPPLPGKKPVISLKKSPSGSGVGIFSKIKDKIADAVDGATGSKPKAESSKENNVSTEAQASTFEQVKREPLLNDVRANRARAPGRRLPTSVYKEDDEEVSGLPNGTSDHGKLENSIKSEDSFKSEGSASSENLDSSDLDAGGEVKPKLREWEKHKAPWLEEMKLNQAKRTSVSPVPEARPKSGQLSDPKGEPETSKSSQNSPVEREVLVPDMSKSMSDVKVSPMEVKPIPKPQKTPPNELDKVPPVKSSVPRDVLGKLLPQPQLLRATPKPRAELYENVVLQKPVTTTSTVHSGTATTSSVTFTSTATTTVSSSSSISSSSNSRIAEEITTVSAVKFNEVLDRLAKLEAKCGNQGQQIEELKNRLKMESELRMILQEKVMRNNVQV
ncbi:SH3 domain-containing kinase-binding protein 1 isoform X2 [Euwallacea similis]|uniref:SH3 domain-containing kinase-binding protein 1 isoform X2 n=1 Tax=Euwallacea similis TaxID=1736056 RepID=UPI00345063DC